MVAVLHDRSASPAEPDQTKQTAKSPYLHVTCLCLLPLVVVTAGAVLFGIGIDLRSSSAIAKNILISAGMAVYVIGVVYFVIINLADQSNDQEDNDEAFASDSVDWIDTELETHELDEELV